MSETNDRFNGIAITGIGLTIPLGLLEGDIVDRLKETRTAIGPLTRFELNGAAAAEVPPFELGPTLEKPKNEKFMSVGVKYAVRSVQQAIADSRLDSINLDPSRVAVHTGSGHTGLDYDEFGPAFSVAWKGERERDFKYIGGRASRLIDAYFSLRTLSNSGVGLISAEFGFQGPGNNYVQSDTSSTWAVLAAASDLAEGRCDVAIAGGYDSLIGKGVFMSYRDAGLLSDRSEMLPFGKARNGIVLGEGATFLVLERLADAEARGARSLALIEAIVCRGNRAPEGFPAYGFDDLRAPVARLIRSGLSPDFVVACGHGTTKGDFREAEALTQLNLSGVPVTAFKGLTGYLGAATASTELALAILCARQGFLPSALLSEPDDQLDTSTLTKAITPITSSNPRVLALASGWGGQRSAILAQIRPKDGVE